jgi:broad specificity phosphatase PhoE
MRLLLVRHGESLGNVTRVLQGRGDPLTDRGRSQARSIAAHLASRGDVRTIYTSPLARALETSQIIGTAIGVGPQPCENLAEINVGTAAGLSFEEWSRRFPEEAGLLHADGVGYAFPGGESARHLGERIAVEIDRIVEAHRDDPSAVVVVSHGGAMAWILAHLLGEPRDVWPSYEFDNCSLTEVTIDGDEVTLVSRNKIGHLQPVAEEEIATGRT